SATATAPASAHRPATANDGVTELSAVGLLDPFLVFFAANAKSRLETRLETLDRDRLPALLTHPQRPLFDLVQRVDDLLQKDFLATAQPEGEGVQILRRSQVHLVGKVVRVQRHVLIEGPLRVPQDLLLFGKQGVAKTLEIFLLQ